MFSPYKSNRTNNEVPKKSHRPFDCDYLIVGFAFSKDHEKNRRQEVAFATVSCPVTVFLSHPNRYQKTSLMATILSYEADFWLVDDEKLADSIREYRPGTCVKTTKTNPHVYQRQAETMCGLRLVLSKSDDSRSWRLRERYTIAQNAAISEAFRLYRQGIDVSTSYRFFVSSFRQFRWFMIRLWLLLGWLFLGIDI